MLHLRSSQFERSKSQYDRLSLTILSVKAGMEHIREKLPANFSPNHGSILTEHQLPDVIRSTGDALVEVHNKAKENELGMDLEVQDLRVAELNKSTNSTRATNLNTRRPMTAGISEQQCFNQRIVLPSARNVSAFDNEDDSEEELGYGEIDAEEEISRDGVKRASRNVIATEERRRLRSKKPEDYS
jgi:hypothetical protein